MTTQRFLDHLYKEAGFDIRRTESGGVIAESPIKYIEVNPHKVMYRWNVEAIDDPSDSDEGVSDRPTEDIIKFIKAGIPGGEETFKHLASNPVMVAQVLRRIAGAYVGKLRLACLRRVLVAVEDLTVGAGFSEYVQVQARNVNELKKTMEAKGWDVLDSKIDEIPILEFNISDQFSGSIRTHTIEYKYEFEVKGYPLTQSIGISNNPARELKLWEKSSEVEEATEEAKSNQKTQGPKAPEASSFEFPGATIPAKVPAKDTIPASPAKGPQLKRPPKRVPKRKP